MRWVPAAFELLKRESLQSKLSARFCYSRRVPAVSTSSPGSVSCKRFNSGLQYPIGPLRVQSETSTVEALPTGIRFVRHPCSRIVVPLFDMVVSKIRVLCRGVARTGNRIHRALRDSRMYGNSKSRAVAIRLNDLKNQPGHPCRKY